MQLRRVVTGHDDKGRAKVMIDEQVSNVFSPRPGAAFSVIWSSEGSPISNDGFEDPSKKTIPTSIDNGTVFRIVSYEPGVTPHRFNRLCRGNARRDRHGARRWRCRASQGR